jgi:hypothetical protein
MIEMTDPALLSSIESMRIEPAGAAINFERRLADENGWSLAFAQRVSVEYRRFIYLAAIAPNPVTPSDEVDQAWHLHLGYSRHYWDVMCSQILGKPLHHGPTAGGAQERARYVAQYETTLALYHETYGETAPTDIWPDSKKRFATRFCRIETGKHWIIPKAAGYVGIATLALAGCSQSGGNSMLVLGVIGAIGAIIIGPYLMARFGRRNGRRKDDGTGCGSGCGTGGSNDNGCGSGCGGD